MFSVCSSTAIPSRPVNLLHHMSSSFLKHEHQYLVGHYSGQQRIFLKLRFHLEFDLVFPLGLRVAPSVSSPAEPIPSQYLFTITSGGVFQQLSGVHGGGEAPGGKESWELLLVSKLGWDLAPITAFDFVDHLLCRVPFLGCDPAVTRKHATTFLALAVIGTRPAETRLGESSLSVGGVIDDRVRDEGMGRVGQLLHGGPPTVGGSRTCYHNLNTVPSSRDKIITSLVQGMLTLSGGRRRRRLKSCWPQADWLAARGPGFCNIEIVEPRDPFVLRDTHAYTVIHSPGEVAHSPLWTAGVKGTTAASTLRFSVGEEGLFSRGRGRGVDGRATQTTSSNRHHGPDRTLPLPSHSLLLPPLDSPCPSSQVVSAVFLSRVPSPPLPLAIRLLSPSSLSSPPLFQG
ncbi:G1/S-specific cyclin-D1 [Portunus trituberculatus]|uniref:G1/S-specific cyclin-D1 n=1 Tax=Portunus trituberculatus TaxID=210409 RepID=A0A5B7DEQ5_PORTR|nr:G1/S-specific cyclin-D1 [Portunus trituberculatus]